jgi:hypothetical protein
VALAACLHVDFVSHNAVFQEQSMGIHYNKGAELLDFVKNKEDFNMEGGFFKPLMKPGLGVEIDEAKVIELSKMRRTGVIRCGGMKTAPSPNGKCASYFALVCVGCDFHPGHILMYAPGDANLAAFLQRELFRAFVSKNINFKNTLCKLPGMVSGFAMPKIWRQIAMDISVTAAKTGRRRYLTLVMIFITVVICYVDRANLAVASAHIQEEFGITKAEMGYVFSAFAWLYTLCQIPAAGSLTAWALV